MKIQEKFSYRYSLILILFVISHCPQAYSQFNTGTFFSGDEFVGSDNGKKIDAEGIGDFVSHSDVPTAGLDIHMPYLFNSGTNVGPGRAFSSYVVSDYEHFWSMYTYPNTLKGYISNPASGAYENNFIMSSVLGHVDFRAKDTHYMRLHDNGRLGISDCFGPYGCGFAAQSLLHLNQSRENDPVWEQFTNGNTGYDTDDRGLSIGIEPNYGYNGSGKSFAKFVQHQDAPMKFYTNDQDRIIVNATYSPTIHSRTVNTDGYVGIGLPNFWGEETGGEGPRSLLHLQGGYNAYANGGNGWRTWNKTGIYINENSDEMYVGLKNESAVNGPNRSDAVIMWGDDQYNMGDGSADNFRLIFSGSNSDGDGTGTNPRSISAYSGLETMRMTPFGKMGVGPLFSWGTPPAKRLEVLDYQNSSGTSLNEAQLRLTYTQGTFGSVNTTGKWTDLQTTGNGDLYIHPSNATVNKNVGINTSTPGNTLEIFSAGTTTTAGGSSGLRFTHLNTTTPPLATNPFGSNPSVLSVDANGDVVLVKDETVSPASGVNICTAGIPNNYLFRMDVSGTNTACKSEIYDDYANLKVGVDDATPSYKLDVNGNFGINGWMYYGGSRILGVDGIYNTNLYLGLNAGPSVLNYDYFNTAIGSNCLSSLANTAGGNTSIGGYSGNLITTGANNNTFGYKSGSRTTTGNNNIFMGYSAGINNQTGNENIAIGLDAASDQLSGFGTSIGNSNIFIGARTGYLSNANSNQNVEIGLNAGEFHTTGSNNVYLGTNAYEDQYQAIITTNSFNNLTLLGNQSTAQLTAPETTLTNATAVGFNSIVRCSDCLTLGDPVTHTLMGYTNVATAGAGTNYRLSVDGVAGGAAAYFNGSVYSSGSFVPSDANLKRNIQPMGSVDQILSALQPKTYVFDPSGQNARLNLPVGLQYGLLSTDVESVLPNLVADQAVPGVYDSLGHETAPSFSFKSVNYVGLIPILIQKTKEQDSVLIQQSQVIDSMKSVQAQMNSRIDQLENAINSCCSNSEHRSSNNITLGSETSIILNQNEPNPFAEETKISFVIPSNVKEAKIIFYDNSGHIMQTVSISDRGNGEITVYGEKLSSGNYFYSLLADGKVIDTKKMICNK